MSFFLKDFCHSLGVMAEENIPTMSLYEFVSSCRYILSLIIQPNHEKLVRMETFYMQNGLQTMGSVCARVAWHGKPRRFTGS